MPYLDRASVAVLGVPFDNVTMDEAVDLIEDKINESGFHQVATANVDFLMHAIQDRQLQEILCSCDLVVADGMPIVWAARMLGTRLKERVSGVDLVPRVAELAARRGYGIYLLGATEQTPGKLPRPSSSAILGYASWGAILRPSPRSKIWIMRRSCSESSGQSPTSCW